MALGEHWMIDIYDFPKTTIERSLEILLEAAKIMKANVIKSFSTETEHENVALVIIDESHLSIHDYRNKFAALDIFTCGGRNMQVGFDCIQKEINFNDYKFVLKTERFKNA